jgi:hypothetical protein
LSFRRLPDPLTFFGQTTEDEGAGEDTKHVQGQEEAGEDGDDAPKAKKQAPAKPKKAPAAKPKAAKKKAKVSSPQNTTNKCANSLGDAG